MHENSGQELPPTRIVGERIRAKGDRPDRHPVDGARAPDSRRAEGNQERRERSAYRAEERRTDPIGCHFSRFPPRDETRIMIISDGCARWSPKRDSGDAS